MKTTVTVRSIIALLSLASVTHATVLTWDTVPGTVGAGDNTITGGAGTWDTVNGNWTADGGANNVAWNNATPDSAIFAGASGGPVTLGANITANSLTFNTAGYTIGTAAGAQTLTLSGAKTITLNTNAQINSVLLGGAPIYGNGNTLTIGGPDPAVGGGGAILSGGTFVLSRGSGSGPYWGAFAGGFILGNGVAATYARFQVHNQMSHASSPQIWKNATLDLNGFNVHQSGYGRVSTLNFYGGGTLLGPGNFVDQSGITYNVLAGGQKALITSQVSVGTLADGAITVGDDPGLPVELEIAGNIAVAGNTPQLNKKGAGTLLLSANNTYTGPTYVQAGTLLVNGAPTGSGAYGVFAGATLGGSGTIGGATTLSNSVTVAGGGRVSPTGTLTFSSSLTLQNNTVYNYDELDLVKVNGALSLANTGWTLNMTEGGRGFQDGGFITLFTYGSLTGATTNLLPTVNWIGAFSPSGPVTLFDTGSTIILQGVSVIPESSTLFLIFTGLATVCFRRRSASDGGQGQARRRNGNGVWE